MKGININWHYTEYFDSCQLKSSRRDATMPPVLHASGIPAPYFAEIVPLTETRPKKCLAPTDNINQGAHTETINTYNYKPYFLLFHTPENILCTCR